MGGPPFGGGGPPPGGGDPTPVELGGPSVKRRRGKNLKGLSGIPGSGNCTARCKDIGKILGNHRAVGNFVDDAGFEPVACAADGVIKASERILIFQSVHALKAPCSAVLGHTGQSNNRSFINISINLHFIEIRSVFRLKCFPL